MNNSFLGIDNKFLAPSDLITYIQSDDKLSNFIEKLSMVTGSFLKEGKLDDDFISISSRFDNYIKHINSFPDSKKALFNMTKFLLSENESSAIEDLFSRFVDNDDFDDIENLLHHCLEFVNRAKEENMRDPEKIIRDKSFLRLIESCIEMNCALSEVFLHSFTKNSELMVRNLDKLSYNDIANITIENSKMMNVFKHLGMIVMTSQLDIEIAPNYCKDNFKNEIDSFFSNYFDESDDASSKVCYKGFDPERKTATVLFYTATKNLQNQALEMSQAMCHELKNRIAYTEKNINDVIKSVSFVEILPTLAEKNWEYLSAPNKEAKVMIKRSDDLREKMAKRGRYQEDPAP